MVKLRTELTVDWVIKEPAHMTTEIATVFSESSDTVHRRLEQKGKMLKLKPGQTMSDYFRIHRAFTRRMNQAVFPNIKDDVTTAHFMVNGPIGHPKLRDAARALRLDGLPERINLLYE